MAPDGQGRAPEAGPGGAAPPPDPATLLRSRRYRVLLVFAAVVGVIVSIASWAFLELVHYLQVGVFEDVPDWLGFDTPPVWWPLPWLAFGGVITALAIQRLPGTGGHVPVDGLRSGGGPTRPVDLPGILLAAVASLGFGIVLGPEAPLILLGAGLAVLSFRATKADAPDTAVAVVAAAGAFAAISSLFGSPIIGAVIIVEAAGLGGATLPLILLPGLMAAGVGSLVFIGMGEWSGLSTSDYALQPITLPAYGGPTVSSFVWTVVLAVAAAVVVFAVLEVARAAREIVQRRPVLLSGAAAVVIAVLAIAFGELTDEPATLVLFSGQEAFGPIFDSPAGLSLSALALLLVLKALAWSISLGNFRGGPTFPALLLGGVAGLLAAELPGLSESPAVAVLMAAACVSILRLPLSSVIIVTVLAGSAGLAVTPLIVVGVAVAYISVMSLDAARSRYTAASAPGGSDTR